MDLQSFDFFAMCGQRCFCCNMSNWIWQIWERICIWSSGQYNPPSPPTKGWNWPFGRIVKQLLHTRHVFQTNQKKSLQNVWMFYNFHRCNKDDSTEQNLVGWYFEGDIFLSKKSVKKLFWYGLHKLFFTHLAQGHLSPSCEHWITLNIPERFEYLLSQQPVDSFPNQN